MYSIFGSKSRKYKYLPEGEPPPKKTVTETDILIKKIAENQTRTNITLTEHLNQKKDFITSETFTDITVHIKGKTDLQEFQANVHNVNELKKLKSEGLDDNDIKVYKDYVSLGPEFWVKYKDLNKDILQQRIDEILQIVCTIDNFDDSKSTASMTRHKPQSVNTTLLKFSDLPKNPSLPGPMEKLPGLEKQFMYDLQEFSKCDIKKIRKKARSMGNKIRELTESITRPEERVEEDNNIQRKTLWDVKEKPANLVKKVELVDKDKVYSCKPQNWFTIRDGKIIKLNDNTIPGSTNTEQSDVQKSKLTVQEIKNIPKFSNYEAGHPSKVLFLKNLGNGVNGSFLRGLLIMFPPESIAIKLMNGRMKGQAFIEFQDESQASDGLDIINGVLVEGKPIIAQFGKKKKS